MPGGAGERRQRENRSASAPDVAAVARPERKGSRSAGVSEPADRDPSPQLGFRALARLVGREPAEDPVTRRMRVVAAVEVTNGRDFLRGLQQAVAIGIQVLEASCAWLSSMRNPWKNMRHSRSVRPSVFSWPDVASALRPRVIPPM